MGVRQQPPSLQLPSETPSLAATHHALMDSDTDSWLRPLALGNRPLAQQWPTNQSLKRCLGYNGSASDGLAMSRTRCISAL